MTRLILIAVVGLGACAPIQAGSGVSPEGKEYVLKRPRIQSVDPTKDNQLRDGVRVIVAAAPFQVERRSASAFRFQTAMLMVGGGPAERRDSSEPIVTPDELRFKIRISNRLPRVVRLAGTAVAFQLAGRTINVPHERYAEFLNGIVLPQQEVTLDLVGPKVSEIVGSQMPGDSATLALLLYDVVTATDAAGTPTKRSNFEFYYRFAMVPTRDSVVQKTCKLKVSLAAYKYLQSVTQNDANRWVRVPEWDATNTCP